MGCIDGKGVGLIHDSLPVLIGTIKSISLKIGFVNLEFLGVCFLQDARQTSCILDIMASIQDNEV